MKLPEPHDKREVCKLHGWVGRRVFQAERHDLCEPPPEEATEDTESSVDDQDDQGNADEEDTRGHDANEEGTPDHRPDPQNHEGDEVPPRRARAGARRRSIPPKKTVAARRITQVDLAAGRAELVLLGADNSYWRPKTRGECSNVPRPCPYVACSKNLFLDVSKTGSIILNFPHLEPWEMPAEKSCVLDLAERGGMTLEQIADATNLTRERIRQVELKALSRRALPAAQALGLGTEDAAAIGMQRYVGPGADLAETGIDGEIPSDVATILTSGDEPSSR